MHGAKIHKTLRFVRKIRKVLFALYIISAHESDWGDAREYTAFLLKAAGEHFEFFFYITVHPLLYPVSRIKELFVC